MARRNHFKSTARRSYRSRNQNNPYFRKKRNVPIKPLLATAGCVLILLVGSIFLLSSEKFAIQHVEISGLEHIDITEIESVVTRHLESSSWLFWKRSNMFLFDAKELESAISEQFTFADVSVSSSGQSLYLSVVERTSNLLWKVGDEYYVVDLEGVIVRKLSNAEVQLLIDSEETGDIVEDLPVFVDKNKIEISVGESVLTSQEINGTFAFQDLLTAQSIEYTFTTFDRLAGKWVSIGTTIGFEILFDPTADAQAQASRLKDLLSNEIDNIEELEYIDLRFGDHIYYQ